MDVYDAEYNREVLETSLYLVPAGVISAVGVLGKLLPKSWIGSFMSQPGYRYARIVLFGLSAGAFVRGVFRFVGLASVRYWFYSMADAENDSSFLRGEFRGSPTFPAPTQKGNAHGKLAAARTTAFTHALHFADRLKMQMIVVGPSRNTDRRKIPGIPVPGKLANCCEKHVEIPPVFRDWKKKTPDDDGVTPLIYMNDEDYRMDMNEFLAGMENPVLISSFTPKQPSEISDEHMHWFEDDYETVVCEIAGGAKYRHKLWDWSPDVLVAQSTAWFGARATVFDVERIEICKNRYLIGLFPRKQMTHFQAILAPFLCSDVRVLRRFSAKHHMEVRGVKTTVCAILGQQTIALSRPNVKYCAVMTYAQYHECLARVDAARCNTSIGNLAVTLGGDVETAAAMWSVCFGSNGPVASAPPQYSCTGPVPAPLGTPTYQLIAHNQPEYDDAKPVVVPFMNPVVLGSTVALLDEGTLAVIANDRVRAVQHFSKIDVSFATWERFREFLAQFGKLIGQIEPLEECEVLEALKRKSQHRLFDIGFSYDDIEDEPRSAFGKREATQAVAAPRVITTYPPGHKKNYAAYVLSLAKRIKDLQAAGKCRWYAFGLTPKAIADRVAEICRAARNNVVMTDFSKFDARKSSFIRLLEMWLLKRVFPRKHWNHLMELHSACYNGVDQLGKVQYEHLWTQGSGCYDTALFNSIVNLFVAFCAYRKHKPHLPVPDFDLLGIFGGDDGLVADGAPAVIREAATDVGYVIVPDVAYRMVRGTVKFLARVYGPGVWYGEPENICDIVRQLSKFHLTTQHVDGSTAKSAKVDIMVAKASCAMMSDRNTYVFGNLIHAILASNCPTTRAIAAERGYLLEGAIADDFNVSAEQWTLAGCPWTAQYSFAEQYPQPARDADWQVTLVSQALEPWMNIDAFLKFLARCAAGRPEELLDIPCAAFEKDPPVKTGSTMIYDGVHFVRGLTPTEYCTRYPPCKAERDIGYQWADGVLITYKTSPLVDDAIQRAKAMNLHVITITADEELLGEAPVDRCTRKQKRAQRFPKPENGESEPPPPSAPPADTASVGSSGAAERTAQTICHNCNEVGHKGWECPNVVCFRCRTKGHYAATCPLLVAAGAQPTAPPVHAKKADYRFGQRGKARSRITPVRPAGVSAPGVVDLVRTPPTPKVAEVAVPTNVNAQPPPGFAPARPAGFQ